MRPAPADPPQIWAQLWHDVGGTLGWDVGANAGQSLTEMTARFTTVIAFEPAVECREHLAPWARYPQVTIIECAVSDTCGQIQLAALPDKIDTGQLVTPGTHGMEWSPDIPAALARTVPARTVDDLARQYGTPDFLKIDVEGHELKVLDGAWTTLAEDTPDLLIEFHTPDLHQACMECLSAHGYPRIDTVRHPHYSPGSPMWFQHGWIKASGTPRA